jgi:hypothetical protein
MGDSQLSLSAHSGLSSQGPLEAEEVFLTMFEGTLGHIKTRTSGDSEQHLPGLLNSVGTLDPCLSP